MFVWLMLILKIPIAALFYLVYWATRPPEPVDDPTSSDDWKRPRVGPDHPRPRKPRSPRRGPHAEPAPPAPARVRVLRGRTLRKPPQRSTGQ